MDKLIAQTNIGHTINLNERKSLIISGIKKIESFDEEEFLLDTLLGYLLIKGENLEIIKLDTHQGNISLKGKIDSFSYVDSVTKKEKDSSIFEKLFK
ncbi:MAG: sporulation protein YabP [Bacilli bacterium]